MNLSSLTQKRQEHVQSCQLNGDHSHRIIANLYSDSTHFIYELLQNAQDAEATAISFTLYPDRLETSHNGRAFSYDDVEAITTIGSSTKSGEANKIGKFGAGFKSVFSITDTPLIHSTPYHFQISDYIIPETIEPFKGFKNELTTVILPFDKHDIQLTQLYNSIEKKLKLIGKDEILFLSNLQRITWHIGEQCGFVEKQIEEETTFRSLVSIRNISIVQYFELYVRDFIIDEKPLQAKIAFAFDEHGYYKSCGSSYSLFVFFPTVIQTNVQFLVHAPYKTTPNRETINFADSQNKEITDNIVELYKAVIMDMVNRKKFTIEMMQLLPISSNGGEIAQALFQGSIELFKNNPLIPTREDSYALPNELFLLYANLDSELFYTAHIEVLFDKSDWITEVINESNYHISKNFIRNYLGVKEITLYDILEKINEPFLLKQSDTWIGRLYAEFPKAQAHVNSYLVSRPLARLKDGSYVPFKSQKNEVQVYLPSGPESRFQCLSQEVCGLAQAKVFFSSIGVSEANVLDEIKTFILPVLINIPSDETAYTEYYQALENLIALYNAASETNKKGIVELFEKNNCLLARKKAELKLQLPKKIYLPTDSLKCWFEGDIDVLILEERIWKLLENEPILEALSCKHSPEIKFIQPHIDTAHKEKLRHTPLNREVNGSDYEWVGLENVIQRPIDENISLILWNFLCRAIEKTNILRGYYRWQCTEHPHEKEFDSKVCIQLKQTTWLFNKEGQLCRPVELKVEELSNIYNYDLLGVDLKEILLLLGFKTDALEELEKQGYRVFTADMAAKFDELLQKEAKEQNTLVRTEPVVWDTPSSIVATWIREVEPTIETNIENIEFKPTKKKDLRYQTPQSFYENDEVEEYVRVVPKAVRKSIGDWSEQYVLHYLQKFCEGKNYTVKSMNENGRVGHGYDFVLMQGEKELRYIEVKGRAEENTTIEISKTQCGFAKFLYDQGEGDKYSIFVVQNAGKVSAKVIFLNNPIQMWLNNELQLENFEFTLSEEH
jgi:hypothetical protein